MGNCFGLFSATPKPPADGAGDPPTKEEPSSKEPPKSGVSPVGEEEVVKKPLTPPSEHNGLPRVSSRPPSDAVGEAPARTASRS
uniref:Uncharacterized protein n=1 Tax=Setaria viridis TaxID=4556 RepID=A0A4U6VUX9_SETVI|nr:hypothetical protein SEVIR_2G176350v2 [Setaria viridis]